MEEDNDSWENKNTVHRDTHYCFRGMRVQDWKL